MRVNSRHAICLLLVFLLSPSFLFGSDFSRLRKGLRAANLSRARIGSAERSLYKKMRREVLSDLQKDLRGPKWQFQTGDRFIGSSKGGADIFLRGEETLYVHGMPMHRAYAEFGEYSDTIFTKIVRGVPKYSPAFTGESVGATLKTVISQLNPYKTLSSTFAYSNRDAFEAMVKQAKAAGSLSLKDLARVPAYRSMPGRRVRILDFDEGSYLAEAAPFHGSGSVPGFKDLLDSHPIDVNLSEPTIFTNFDELRKSILP